MSSSKSWRKIHVEGVDYRWRVAGDTDSVRLAIRPVDLPGGVLRCCFDVQPINHFAGPEVAIEAQSTIVITPVLVRRVIERALFEGYLPQRKDGEREIDSEQVDTSGAQFVAGEWSVHWQQRIGRISLLSVALADALADDPFYRALVWDFGSPEMARQRLAEYMQLSMDEATVRGRLDVVARQGAALWITGKDESAQQQKRLALGRVLGPQGQQNYLKMVEAMQRQLPPGLQDAHYLSILGVAPQAQGQGLGSELLAPGLRAADVHGKACYLETYSQESIKFYNRFGFETLVQRHEPTTDSPYWVMVRGARAE